jgi:hypothetical protein
MCATINSVIDPSDLTPPNHYPPWLFADKSGSAQYGPHEFIEAGLDLTYIFSAAGRPLGCFAHVLAETRSSGSSLNAILKDFALGSLGVCSIAAEKSGPVVAKAGDPASYTVTITNTGIETLYLRNVNDTLVGALYADGVSQDPVTGGTCGESLAPAASCTITYGYTVPAGSGPLQNTVTVEYNEKDDFTGPPFTSSSSWSTQLFAPSINITKVAAPKLVMIGTEVTYTFTITNTTPQSYAPPLVLDTSVPGGAVQDTLLRNITASVPPSCFPLASGASCNFTVKRTVLAGDPAEITNTVTVYAKPQGWPNDVHSSASDSVWTFAPDFTISKTVNPSLSKLGDAVTYTFTITNTTPAPAGAPSAPPPLVLKTITDTVLPDLVTPATSAGCTALAQGASCSFQVPWPVACTDVYPPDGNCDDPVRNTVPAVYHPSGFSTAEMTRTASADLNLFQPGVTISKACPSYSKPGDPLPCTITACSASSADTPGLSCTISDPPFEKLVTLSPGGCDTSQPSRTVPTPHPDATLTNEATVECSPAGFPANKVSDSSIATVTILHPGLALANTCTTALVAPGGVALFHVTAQNTSSDTTELVDATDDGLDGPYLAGSEASDDVPVSVPPYGDTVSHSLSAVVTLPAHGLPNTINFGPLEASCRVGGKGKVTKTVLGLPPAPGQVFTFEIRQGASPTSDGTIVEDNRQTDEAGVIEFAAVLDPSLSYQLCERLPGPGWSTTLPDPFTPNILNDPDADTSLVCSNFTVTANAILDIAVDNSYPLGNALTIGYWKNHASCKKSKGNQAPVLDRTLAAATPPGLLVDDPPRQLADNSSYLVGDPSNPDVAPSCRMALALLNKSDYATEKKRASDPLYNMAAQMIAAELNYNAPEYPAYRCQPVTDAIAQANALLYRKSFTGTGARLLLPSEAALANCLAQRLDDYNNNRPNACSALACVRTGPLR